MDTNIYESLARIASIFVEHLVGDGDGGYCFDTEEPIITLGDLANLFPNVLKRAENALLEADASHEALLFAKNLANDYLNEGYAIEQQVEEASND